MQSQLVIPQKAPSNTFCSNIGSLSGGIVTIKKVERLQNKMSSGIVTVNKQERLTKTNCQVES